MDAGFGELVGVVGSVVKVKVGKERLRKNV